MNILYIIALLVLFVGLGALEIFVIPGFGVAGIGAIAAGAYANWLAFTTYGTTGGLITLGATAVICGIGVYLFFATDLLQRVAQKETIDSTAATADQLSVKVGDKGVSTTRLAPIGQAAFGDKLVEVRSADGLLDENTPIIITRVQGATVTVKQLKESSNP